MKPLTVLSLFDGISAGQVALQRAGISVKQYYASEIDKHAIKVTQHNFPETIQLGDVTKVNGMELPEIDLLIFGFPCQSHSVAGKGLGFEDPRGQLFFDAVRIMNQLRIKNPNLLFLAENVKMKKESIRVISGDLGVFPWLCNSALVSAQNRERNFWSNINIEMVGLFEEAYTHFPMPKDKGILLKDVLQPETEVNDKYYLSDKMMNYLNTRKDNFNAGKINYKEGEDKASCINASSGHIDISDNIIVTGILNQEGILSATEKSTCIDANYQKGMDNHSQRTMIKIETRTGITNNEGEITERDKATCLDAHYQQCPDNHGQRTMIRVSTEPNQIDSLYGNNAQAGRIYSEDGKSVTINANGGGLGGKTGLYKVGRIVGRNPENPKSRESGLPTEQMLELREDDKSGTLSTVHKDNVVLVREVKQVNPSKESDNKQPYQQNRVYDTNGIAPALNTIWNGGNLINTARIRRLTPIECERLQTFPDNYTDCVSDSQRYKALGNSWTVDVVVHIFSFIKNHFADIQ